MATKKSSKRASSKKSNSTKTTRVTKKTLDEAKADVDEKHVEAEKAEAKTNTADTKADVNDNAKSDAKDDDTDEVVEVVEVVETEPAKTAAANTEKKGITDRLASLNPAAMLAEAFGTFVLSAVILSLATNQYYGSLGIALTLAALVVIFGAISGAHLNPAITIAAWINKKVDGVKAFAYIVAQFVGAALAILALTGITNANFSLGSALKSVVISQNVATEADIAKAGSMEQWSKDFLKNQGTTEITNGKTATEMVAEMAGIDTNSEAGVKISDTAKPKVHSQLGLEKGQEWGALAAEVLGTVIFGLGAGYALFSKRKCAISKGLAMGLGMFVGLAVAGSTAILNPAVAVALGAFHWGDFATVAWPIVVYVLGSVLGMVIGVSIYRLLAKNSDNADEEFEA